jgi:hypothetical protein
MQQSLQLAVFKKRVKILLTKMDSCSEINPRGEDKMKRIVKNLSGL